MKNLTITDFPILERSQFFNVQKTPFKEELMLWVHESGIKDKISTYSDKQPKSCQLAAKILFDQRKPIVFKHGIVEQYTYPVVENAKSYMANYIKMGAIPQKDHVAIVAWFIEQLVDIDQTAALNNWIIK